MNGRKIFWLISLSFCILLAACSSDSGFEGAANDSSDDMDYGQSEEKASSEFAGSYQDTGEASDQDSPGEGDTSNNTKQPVERKIIYEANLSIEVKDYQQSLNNIQAKVSDYGGYIVESNMNSYAGDGSTSGYITARIPQERFQEFINLVEESSNRVLDSTTSGTDVTEEYVDLESRLKSMRVVEKRLLSFMEQAEKTEDLLAISNDLAKVQEEIETVIGRMNYLTNRADLATVTIHMEEYHVSLASINDEDLNTWEKTKQQFLKSINMLLSFFSGLIVFVIGNLPVILLLGIIGGVIYWIIKRRRRED